MSVKRNKCLKCDGDHDSSSCLALENAGNNKINLSSIHRTNSVKVPVKLPESNYVLQVISICIRADNVYEAKMLLAPEVDMSSIKITVKGNNLRATVQRPLNNNLLQLLPGITETSQGWDLIKKTVKHRENFLIPEAIDGDQVRAVVDNKHRMLILTAPTMKPSKAIKRFMTNK